MEWVLDAMRGKRGGNPTRKRGARKKGREPAREEEEQGAATARKMRRGAAREEEGEGVLLMRKRRRGPRR